MRENYTERLTINLTKTLKYKLKNIADKFGWGISDVVRECIETELPRLIQREQKRVQRQTNLERKQ